MQVVNIFKFSQKQSAHAGVLSNIYNAVKTAFQTTLSIQKRFVVVRVNKGEALSNHPPNGLVMVLVLGHQCHEAGVSLIPSKLRGRNVSRMDVGCVRVEEGMLRVRRGCM